MPNKESQNARLPLMCTFITLCALLAAQPSEAQTREPRGIGIQQSAEVSRLPAASKRFALIVGINDYQHRQVTDLEGAANDARSLEQALIRYAGFPRQNVTTLISERGASRPLDSLPTRANILDQLSELLDRAKQSGDDGMILLAFAGHGLVQPQPDGKKQAYLLPMDGFINQIQSTALRLTDIRDEIEKSGVGQVVFIVDACRNEPEAGRSSGANVLTEPFKAALNFETRNQGVKAFATIYATGLGQRAYEYNDGGQMRGYFTSVFVKGLRGAAANSRHEVTLANLINYVETEVPKQVSSGKNRGRSQVPFSDVEGYRANGLVISAGVNNAGAIDEDVVNDDDKTSSLDSSDSSETRLWENLKDSKDAKDFREYLRQYPDGRYGKTARDKLRQLTAASSVKRVDSNFFTIELQKCRISGTSVICDLTVTNNDQDRQVYLDAYGYGIGMVDDSGNQYRVEGTQLANSVGGRAVLLVKGVTTKARLTFENVSPSARKAALIAIGFGVHDGRLNNGRGFIIQFRDVPLTDTEEGSNSSRNPSDTRPSVSRGGQQTFTIRPGPQWTDTGIDVEPGMKIEVRASGAIATDGAGLGETLGENFKNILRNRGSSSSSRPARRSIGPTALIAGVRYTNGGLSNVLRVGSKSTLTVEAGEYGRLMLGIDLTYGAYTNGSFTVQVTW